MRQEHPQQDPEARIPPLPGSAAGAGDIPVPPTGIERPEWLDANVVANAREESRRTIELREEELVAQKELVDLGEVVIRTTVDEVPGRLEVDAFRDEAVVEHIPVGEVVTERKDPWEEDGAFVIPLYEEQLVLVKRLYLREHIRIRRVGTTARQIFEDTLRRERLVIEDPQQTGLIHEVFPRDDAAEPTDPEQHKGREGQERPGFFANVVRKAFE